MSALDHILQDASKQIRLAFTEASTKYTTPDDIAQHREEIIGDFLKGYFPLAYQIGKGEIIDSNGARSGQMDVIICTPFHPFTVSKSSSRSLFFAEGVACAIDVKSDLPYMELERGLRQVWKVKKLERKPTPGDLMYGSTYDQERLRRIPTILFGYEAPSLETLKANIIKLHENLRISTEEQVDAVVILDKGIIYNIKDARDRLMIAVSGERRLGLVGFELKEKTMVRFLLYLSQVIPWETRMSPIIQLYAGALSMESGKVF
jgi:hypothetical protein